MVVSSPDIHMFGQNIPEHNPALSRAGDPLPRSASPDRLLVSANSSCERAGARDGQGGGGGARGG